MICKKLEFLALVLFCAISFCIILANGAQAADDNTGSIWENFNTFENYLIEHPPKCLLTDCGGSTTYDSSTPYVWRVKFRCQTCHHLTYAEGKQSTREIFWYHDWFVKPINHFLSKFHGTILQLLSRSVSSSHLCPYPVIHHVRRSLILGHYRNYIINRIKLQPLTSYVTPWYYLMWPDYIRNGESA